MADARAPCAGPRWRGQDVATALVGTVGAAGVFRALGGHAPRPLASVSAGPLRHPPPPPALPFPRVFLARARSHALPRLPALSLARPTTRPPRSRPPQAASPPRPRPPRAARPLPAPPSWPPSGASPRPRRRGAGRPPWTWAVTRVAPRSGGATRRRRGRACSCTGAGMREGRERLGGARAHVCGLGGNPTLTHFTLSLPTKPMPAAASRWPCPSGPRRAATAVAAAAAAARTAAAAAVVAAPPSRPKTRTPCASRSSTTGRRPPRAVAGVAGVASCAGVGVGLVAVVVAGAAGMGVAATGGGSPLGRGGAERERACKTTPKNDVKKKSGLRWGGRLFT